MRVYFRDRTGRIQHRTINKKNLVKYDRKQQYVEINRKRTHNKVFVYFAKETKPKETEPKKTEQNVLLLISIGDYKHVSFDIIVKRAFTADDFKNLIKRSKTVEDAHERIRNETINLAIADLRSRGHFGLANMLKNNTDIDYVEGGEYTWTDEPAQDTHFTRFDIRGHSRLQEILGKREVPKEYDAKNQKKIGE